MKIRVDEKREYSVSPCVVIQCQKNNEEVQEIVSLLESKDKKIIGKLDEKEHIISPQDILYAESVDGSTYIYTSKQVYKTAYTLANLESDYKERGFFRCSKSAVLNIGAIEWLKSEMGSRIDARLINGEHIIISRRYGKELRRLLKGVEKNETSDSMV